MKTQQVMLKREFDATTAATAASTDKPEPRRPYATPHLHEIGSLSRLQAYGFNYRDGTRYKCTY